MRQWVSIRLHLSDQDDATVMAGDDVVVTKSGIADALIEGTAISHDHVGQKTCSRCTILASTIAICAST